MKVVEVMTLNDSNAVPRKVTGRKNVDKVTMLYTTKIATLLKMLSRQVIPFFSSFKVSVTFVSRFGSVTFFSALSSKPIGHQCTRPILARSKCEWFSGIFPPELFTQSIDIRVYFP